MSILLFARVTPQSVAEVVLRSKSPDECSINTMNGDADRGLHNMLIHLSGCCKLFMGKAVSAVHYARLVASVQHSTCIQWAIVKDHTSGREPECQGHHTAVAMPVVQCLRVSSGDRVAAVKWTLPPDGARVMFITAEVDFVSRKGAAGRGPAMEVDSLLLIQHLTSRFSGQVKNALCH